MNKQEQAIAMHKAGSNCAQSVLGVFAADLGIDPIQAHRMAAAMGAGLGRRQLLCGAVSGGALALGAAFGSKDGSDQEAKELTYEIVRDYVRGVEEQFGPVDCRALLGVDLLTEAGKEEMKARGLGDSVCGKIIARCVLGVEKILAERGKN